VSDGGIEFRVVGEPASKGNRSGRESEELRRWRAAVRLAVGSRERVAGPCVVDITFLIPETKMQAENRQNPYGPDLDNLVKPVFDEIKQGVIRDDGAVFELRATKRRAEPEEHPGAVIHLRPLPGGRSNVPAPTAARRSPPRRRRGRTQRRVEIHRGR